jgi:threonylcarbamoyladenosine tRNA methylthiotransferase MtaB
MKCSRHILLTEKGGIGRTPCFTPVAIDGAARPGELVAVAITGRTGDHLTGITQ